MSYAEELKQAHETIIRIADTLNYKPEDKEAISIAISLKVNMAEALPIDLKELTDDAHYILQRLTVDNDNEYIRTDKEFNYIEVRDVLVKCQYDTTLGDSEYGESYFDYDTDCVKEELVELGYITRNEDY